MSTTIDERVVEMRFDNKQFESNVSTSMSTLKKLKESLKFTGATKGLEEIDAASKRVNMSGLGSAVDSVKARFSALDVVAVTALANITNSAVNAGKRLISSLSVDQISAGWDKFGEKTTSVATLVAQGNAIEDVNKQLDLLNWFTDETSYNFTDMVSNIAKFTASGKGLEESVTAMEGIATWAALSGQNAMTASRAMYQLSQAMGAGVMRREDYRSIQNASMDTMEFRENCIQAAIALGTLKDNGNGTYSSIVKGAKKTSFTISQFADNLTDGLWLTSDVMMSVYTKYASAVNGIYEAVEEKGFDNASQVLTEIHDKADQLKDGVMTDEEAIDAAIKELGYTLEDGSLKFDHFGVKAFEAAQQARTFRDVIDSVKDAVSTGWMNTFEKIFGDSEQATKLWTMMAEELWTTFAGGGERRNNILDQAMGSGWDKLSERISDAGFEMDSYESKVKELAKAGGADIDNLVSKYGSLGDVFKNGALDTKYLTDALSGLGKKSTEASTEVTSALEKIKWQLGFGSEGKSVENLQKALVGLGYNLDKYGVDGLFKSETEAAVKAFQKDAGLEVTGIVNPKTLAALKEAAKAIETVGDASEEAQVSIDDLLESISRPSGRELLFDTISNSLQLINGVLGAFRDAWAEVFSEEGVASGLYNGLKAVKEFTDGFFELDEEGNRVLKNFDQLKQTFQGFISVLDIVISLVGGAVKFVFQALGVVFGGLNFNILDASSGIGVFLTELAKTIKEGEYIGKMFEWLLGVFKSGVDWIKNWFSGLFEAFKDTAFVKEFSAALTELKDVIDKFKKGEVGLFTLGEAIGNFAWRILNAIPAFKKWFETFKESETFKKWVAAFAEFQALIQKFKSGEIGFGDLLSGLGDFISKALMSIPIIEKWVTAVQNWYASFKETPAVKQLVSAINSISEAFNKLKAGDIDFSEFGTALGENLAKALIALPEILRSVGKGFSDGAQQIASDFIQGFQNGIFGKVSEVIGNIVNFCTNFISSFKEALGEHSPSVIAEEAGINFIQGFINGIKAAIGAVIDAITGVGEKIVGAFGTVWDKISEVAGKIDWGRLFAGGSIVALIYSAVTISNAISRISKAISGIGDLIASAKKVLDNFSVVLKSFGKVLDGIAWDFKAKALLKMAIAIGILAAAVWVIAQIPRENLISSVVVVGVLAGVLAALGFAMSKMGQASVDLKNKSADIKGVNTVLLQIAIAIIAVAAAIKMLGSMDSDQLKQGLLSVAGIVVAIIASVAILGKISNKSKDVDKFGLLMLKMAGAFLIMGFVAKLLGGMDRTELIQGGAAIVAFSLIIVGLMWATKLISGSKNVGEIGSALMKIAAAIGIMALVAKLLGGMDRTELIQGGVAIAAFGGIIVGLMAATKLITGSKNVGEIGGALLKIAAAIAIMALVAKLLGGMDPLELVQGTLAVTAFGGIIVGLMAATKLISGSKNVGQIGAALLGVAGAIAIIAGIAILLSFMSWESFAKGAVMVTAFAGIIVGLMAATKLIGRSEQIATVGKTLMMVSGAIAILAGIAVLLGMIPTENLVKGLAAVVVLGIVMAGLIAVTSLAKKCIGTLTVLTVMVGVMAACIWVLSSMSNSDKALTSALALGGLMLAMAGVIAIFSLIGPSVGAAILGAVAMAALGLVLREFVWVLSSMEGLENARSNALTLVILAGACTAMVAVLTLVGFGALAAIAGVAALALLGLVLREFVWVLSTMEGLTDAEANASILIRLMETLGGVLVKISLLGPLAIVGEAAVLGLVGLIGVIGVMATAVGALMTKFPNIQKFLDTGIPVLEQLAEGIGSMIGKLVGGVISGIGDSIINTLPRLGIALSAFMVGASPFIAIAKSVDSSVVTGAGCIAAAILVLTGANFISGIASLLTFGQSSFEELGKQLVTFGLSANIFANSISGIDASSIEAASNVSGMILTLTATEFISGIMDLFGGGIDFAAIGEKLNSFGEAVVGFSNTISGKIDTEAVNAAANAGEMLVSLNQSLPRSGGWIQDIIGEKDFDKFATACGSFAKCILTINATLSQDGVEIQSEKIEQLTKAGTQFSELNNALPRSGGVAQDLAGEKDLSKFGKACSAFATCMIAINATLSQDGVDIQSDKLAALTKAGTQFSDLNNALPKSGGIAQDLAGEQDLSVFGEACAAFATCMIGVNSAVSQEGFSVNLEAIDQIKQAGDKMNELQDSLPKTGGWWQEVAGSQDIGDFGTKIGTFATAIVDFSTSASNLNTGAIDTAISTAEKMKDLLTSLVGIDYSGVASFTGVGTGGFGADGPIYKVGKAITAFSTELDGINTENINVAVNAATRLKTLIAGLVGLDTSGVELFKPSVIGSEMKTYSESIVGIDPTLVSSSITAANSLKALISGLVGLDTSGMENFNPQPIGTAIKGYSDQISSVDTGNVSSSISVAYRLKSLISSLSGLDNSGVSKFNISTLGNSIKNYSNSVTGFNPGNVTSSITAASKLRDFVTSLAGINTSGVTSFKAAISELGTISAKSIADSFSGVTAEMSTIGAGIVTAFTTAIAPVSTNMGILLNNTVKAIRSKISLFRSSAITVASAFVSGIRSRSSAASSAGSSIGYSAGNAASSGYWPMYSNGSYIVDGLKKGIEDNKYKVFNAVETMADELSTKFRITVLIGSPSKLFAEYGKFIDQGLAIGINDNSNTPVSAVAEMAGNTLSTMQSVISKASDMFNFEGELQPTIRPIVDLSDVRTGAAAVSGIFGNVQTVGVRSNLNAINLAMNSRSQNRSNDDIISAINKLGDGLANNRGDTYNFGDFTYDDGSNVADAVGELIRYAKIGRRV